MHLPEVTQCSCHTSSPNQAASEQSLISLVSGPADAVKWLLGRVSLHLSGEDCADVHFIIGCWLIQKLKRLLHPWVTEASFGHPGKKGFRESQYYLLGWKFQTDFLSLHMHAEQGSSWKTAMLCFAVTAQELKQAWGLQSHSFPPALRKSTKIWVMILLVPQHLLLPKIFYFRSVFKDTHIPSYVKEILNRNIQI